MQISFFYCTQHEAMPLIVKVTFVKYKAFVGSPNPNVAPLVHRKDNELSVAYKLQVNYQE